ncbi:MAG: hypothetical protein GY821_02975 [Gammaproteobacteria bacterium]|nr:hypothetical protein [Gammaproteobacteria bacterium]
MPTPDDKNKQKGGSININSMTIDAAFRSHETKMMVQLSREKRMQYLKSKSNELGTTPVVFLEKLATDLENFTPDSEGWHKWDLHKQHLESTFLPAPFLALFYSVLGIIPTIYTSFHRRGREYLDKNEQSALSENLKKLRKLTNPKKIKEIASNIVKTAKGPCTEESRRYLATLSNKNHSTATIKYTILSYMTKEKSTDYESIEKELKTGQATHKVKIYQNYGKQTFNRTHDVLKKTFSADENGSVILSV